MIVPHDPEEDLSWTHKGGGGGGGKEAAAAEEAAAAAARWRRRRRRRRRRQRRRRVHHVRCEDRRGAFYDKVGAGRAERRVIDEGLEFLWILRVGRSGGRYRLKLTQCLIFCRTNLDCDRLEAFLNAAGGGKGFRGKAEKGVENSYSCVVLAGGRAMNERRSISQTSSRRATCASSCTDVAARGLDIKELPCVINMTLPDVQGRTRTRIGRTGRAEAMGLAVSLVATRHKEKVWYYDKRKARVSSCRLSCRQSELWIWYDDQSYSRQWRNVSAAAASRCRVEGCRVGCTLGQAKDGGSFRDSPGRYASQNRCC